MKTQRIHGYRWQGIQGVRIANKKVELQLKKRRYRCLACPHTLFEKLSFIDRYQHHTVILAQEALSLSSEMCLTHAGRLVGVSANRLRRAETLEKYFKQCDTANVQIVVMDLSKAFKESVRRQLVDPLIIADRFYFMRQAYWVFGQVRREVKHDLYQEQRIRLKRNKEFYGSLLSRSMKQDKKEWRKKLN
ncbi:hypothetical protein BTR23_18535 [Alkalihalophilus pseudofirmus]|nr:hypothetical protein BTR23_18535 [Alkalihalophilus pseudofirmus]